MENWLLSAVVVIMVQYWLLRTTILIELYYRRNGGNDSVRACLKLFGGRIQYALRIPVVEITDRNGLPWLESELESEQESERGDIETPAWREKRRVRRSVSYYLRHPRKLQYFFEMVKQFVRDYRRFIENVAQEACCERFQLSLVCGAEDAAVTGLASGVFWAVIGNAICGLQGRVRFIHPPNVSFTPVFNRKVFELRVECIFSIRVGKLLKVIVHQIRTKRKGGSAR